MSNPSATWTIANTIAAIIGAIVGIVAITIATLEYLKTPTPIPPEPPIIPKPPDNRIKEIIKEMNSIDSQIREFEQKIGEYSHIESIHQIEKKRVKNKEELRNHIEAIKQLEKKYPILKNTWNDAWEKSNGSLQATHSAILGVTLNKRILEQIGQQYLIIKGEIVNSREKEKEIKMKLKSANEKLDYEESIQQLKNRKGKLMKQLDKLSAITK